MQDYESYIDSAELYVLVPENREKDIKIFLDEDMAKKYIACHEGYEMRVQENADFEKYTPFCIVEVEDRDVEIGYKPSSWKTGPMFKFRTLCFEDYAEDYIEKSGISITDYCDSKYPEEEAEIRIYIRRIIPLKYNGPEIKKKIEKFLNELFAEATYMLHEGGWDDKECMREARKGTEAYVRERLNEFKL